MNAELQNALERVARRIRIERLWFGLAAGWSVATLIALSWYLLSERLPEATLPLSLLLIFTLAAVFGAGLGAILALRSMRDPRNVARRIEAFHPELNAVLLTATDRIEARSKADLTFLEDVVVRQALEHHKANDWGRIVSPWSYRLAQAAHWIALGGLLICLILLFQQSRSEASGRSWFDPNLSLAGNVEVIVEPGDVELERGAALLVVARFPVDVPSDAVLVVESKQGVEEGRMISIPMTRSLDDPAFAARVPAVDGDLNYQIEFDDNKTKDYQVTVFEYPALKRTDASLEYPRFAGTEPKVIEDIRQVSAVEGTELTLDCFLNKEVESAQLVARGSREVLELERRSSGPSLYGTKITLDSSERYELQLVDAEGRSNNIRTEIVVNVIPNHPASLKLTKPGSDVDVSPLEELRLAARFNDDFGLLRYGLSYELAGKSDSSTDLVLYTDEGWDAQGTPPRTKEAETDQLIDFEDLNAVPDQLLSYHFWVEDLGPNDQPRRTSGDLYFAEVRRFEEIFRQGEQPSASASSSQQQGQQGAGQQASELAELQKELINATWSVVRREEARTALSDSFNTDARTLRESQQAVIDQATALGDQIEDEQSRLSFEKALEAMNDALSLLRQAEDKRSVAFHLQAMAPERLAYQALLELRAREFQVIQQNSQQNSQGGSASGSGNRMQRQLDQLEFNAEQNRYENERSANPDEQSLDGEQERETREILNRLRELARRQNDLNERLNELQSALEAAETPEEREEIERQLKRLREQQEQLLRDTDELRNRMEQEENRERMSEARERLDNTRENLRRASEALEEGQVSQAITSGARAEQELEDLRDDLRRQASDEFAQEMTELRRQAESLQEEQELLTEALMDDANEQNRSLRDSGEREAIQERLGRQQEELQRLIEDMQETVTEAEKTEPLLAEELFEAARQAAVDRIDEELDMTERLTDAGIIDEAASLSRNVEESLERLREGVDQAAERVLGDGTQALRLAQNELEDLSDAIGSELERVTPETSPNDDQNPESSSDTSESAPQRSGANDSENQESQGEPGSGSTPTQEEQPGDPQQGRDNSSPTESGEQPSSDGSAQNQSESPGESSPSGRPQGGGGLRNRDATPQGNNPLESLVNNNGFGGGPSRPITGGGFREWSDRMRDVEELIEDPDLRSDAARIRDRVQGFREEFKRRSEEPDWNKLQDLVAQPLEELQQRIAEEIRLREAPDSLVPIDRDPVPPRFAELVREYYEQLGSGE